MSKASKVGVLARSKDAHIITRDLQARMEEGGILGATHAWTLGGRNDNISSPAQTEILHVCGQGLHGVAPTIRGVRALITAMWSHDQGKGV